MPDYEPNHHHRAHRDHRGEESKTPPFFLGDLGVLGGKFLEEKSEKDTGLIQSNLGEE
ncbi:MAG: hypothetical protein RLZZ453_595 [Chlamydiota bacterium]|jgi:hypothetical protein